MSARTLRIRHYIGSIVAGCSIGGLLLAMELAFLVQSMEANEQVLHQRGTNLSEVRYLASSLSTWIGEARRVLDEPDRRKGVEERARGGLLLELEKLRGLEETAPYEVDLTRVRANIDDILELLPLLPGVHSTTLEPPGMKKVREAFDSPAGEATEALARVTAGLEGELEAQTVELAGSRKRLWRTALISTLAYVGLVLLLWRWVVRKLLRPLRALMQESRRTLSGETDFQLVPDGPFEVRLLNESISTLVGGLVSARGNLEQKVRERTLELERANRAKNEFLANMSHEIRTPMTAIMGYAELCLAPDVREQERRRYSEIIHTNGEHLLSVINDILDVSKIEAGRMTAEPTVCSPFSVVSEVRALMEVRARSKGLELRVQGRGAIPEVVRTDPTRLRQILLNLVNNAIKFTEQGHVSLTFGMETQGGAERLVFAVQDTGVGMNPDELERVFNPFVQADSSTTRKYGGSGLGLTISRTLARLLGGELWGTSEVGKGSDFRVSIDPGPLEGVRRIDQAPEALPAIRPAGREPGNPASELSGRVLLAEDVAVNRRLISTLLRRAGLEVDEAEHGRIALEKAQEARATGRPYDLIFMDMQMPEMDGYEATRRLREAGYTLPIVALTAHSMTGERERCLDAGCSDFMTKPVERLALLKALSRFLGQDAQRQAS